jgi:hypothetical protein
LGWNIAPENGEGANRGSWGEFGRSKRIIDRREVEDKAGE